MSRPLRIQYPIAKAFNTRAYSSALFTQRNPARKLFVKSVDATPPKPYTVDVATTLAWLGTKPPSGAAGQVLIEVVGQRGE
jgi:hypothetical protein